MCKLLVTSGLRILRGGLVFGWHRPALPLCYTESVTIPLIATDHAYLLDNAGEDIVAETTSPNGPVSATTAIRSQHSLGHTRSDGPPIRVMETTEHRERDDFGSGAH